MSTSPPARLVWWARLGFAFYLVVGIFVAGGNLFVRVMGPCPAFSSNTVCSWSRAEELWLFPVSQMVVLGFGIAFGMLVRRWTNR